MDVEQALEIQNHPMFLKIIETLRSEFLNGPVREDVIRNRLMGYLQGRVGHHSFCVWSMDGIATVCDIIDRNGIDVDEIGVVLLPPFRRRQVIFLFVPFGTITDERDGGLLDVGPVDDPEGGDGFYMIPSRGEDRDDVAWLYYSIRFWIQNPVRMEG